MDEDMKKFIENRDHQHEEEMKRYLGALQEQHSSDLMVIGKKLDHMSGRLDKVEYRLEKVEDRLESVEETVEEHTNIFRANQETILEHDKDIEELKLKVT